MSAGTHRLAARGVRVDQRAQREYSLPAILQTVDATTPDQPSSPRQPIAGPSPSRSSRVALDHHGAYGRAFADVYDRWYHDVTDADATADFVAERTPSGIVIELGVGTGRLARPLLNRGLTVIGIDSSGPMLAACPSSVGRVRADMTSLPLAVAADARSGVTALCGFNTFFNLTGADLQRKLFHQLASVADTVVIETINADSLDQAPRRSTGVSRTIPDGLVVSSTVIEIEHQLLLGRHLEISDGAVLVRPWMLRWTTSRELDSMATDAGFELVERWESWAAEPFGPESPTMISVHRLVTRSEP